MPEHLWSEEEKALREQQAAQMEALSQRYAHIGREVQRGWEALKIAQRVLWGRVKPAYDGTTDLSVETLKRCSSEMGFLMHQISPIIDSIELERRDLEETRQALRAEVAKRRQRWAKSVGVEA